MNEKKKKIYIILFVITITVIVFSIVYAALTTSLKIKYENLAQNTSIWDVKLKKGEINDENVITSNKDTVDCGHVTATNNSIKVDSVKLSRPGDMCSYPITVENKGEINARLAKISAFSPVNISCDSKFDGELICGNIVYRLTTDSDGKNILTAGSQRIKKIDGTANFYLVVSILEGTTNEKTVTHSGAGFTVVYAQDN